VKHILVTGLQATSDLLGDKPFIMGQTPCEVDCSVFGLLSQFVWHVDDDILTNLIQEKFPTLYNYCLRMKERFWPDWDYCITHGGTRPATK
jgi:glutathione S-transferase